MKMMVEGGWQEMVARRVERFGGCARRKMGRQDAKMAPKLQDSHTISTPRISTTYRTQSIRQSHPSR